MFVSLSEVQCVLEVIASEDYSLKLSAEQHGIHTHIG